MLPGRDSVKSTLKFYLRNCKNTTTHKLPWDQAGGTSILNRVLLLSRTFPTLRRILIAHRNAQNQPCSELSRNISPTALDDMRCNLCTKRGRCASGRGGVSVSPATPCEARTSKSHSVYKGGEEGYSQTRTRKTCKSVVDR